MHKFSRRGGAALGLVGLACAVGLLAASSVQGKDGDLDEVGQKLAARAEIEALTYCYASGTDAIGSGDVEKGRAFYKSCFTPNAVIGASFPGADPNGPPQLTAIGPDGWVAVVDDVFTSSGYVATQHLISNVRISIDGNSATMESYLNATHVIDPESSIDLANGTYYDVLVRTPKGWRIAKRTLWLNNFLRLESP